MLSSIDWMLLGVLALSALLGVLRGFVAEVLSMVVWVAAFWLAFMYGADAADTLQPQMTDPAGRMLLAYALVFIAALVTGSVVTWMVGKLVRTVGLGGVDRFLGLLYCLMRGIALGCVLVLVLGFTALPRQPEWNASPLVPEYQRGAEWIKDWLPEAASKHVNFGAVAEQGKQEILKAVGNQLLQASLPLESPPADSPSEDSTPEEVPSPPRPRRHESRRKDAPAQRD
jgi:membrane protein required for colicin V production